MEDRGWKWTDAHFYSLPSQTNIYGCTKLLGSDGANKILVASLVGKFFTIEYERIFDKLTPTAKEVQFTYIPGESEIVSVDATSKGMCGDELTVGITFWKLEDNESKQFLNMYRYTASPHGDEFNLECVSSLQFMPYQLTHTQLIVNGSTETVFLLSGSDNKIHLYRELPGFTEDHCEKYFPELADLSSCALWLDMVYYANYEKRVTAIGHQSGIVTLSVVNVTTTEVVKSYSVDHDSPVTYVKIFSPYNTVSKPSFLHSGKDRTDDKKTSLPNFHLLVLSALIPATVYRNILRHGLSDPVYLPDSNKYDTVLCGCIVDVDFDGENEILIGTYGQELLAYKLKPDTSTARVHKESCHSTKSSHSSASESDLHDVTKIRHRSGEAELSTTSKIEVPKPTRRVKSQENLSSSVGSDADYISMSLSKEATVSSVKLSYLSPEKRLAHVWSEDGNEECSLLWRRSFASPVQGINRVDIMGDGMDDLVTVTLKGIHILQPDLTEVSSVCLERLRLLSNKQTNKANWSMPRQEVDHTEAEKNAVETETAKTVEDSAVS